MSIVYGINPVMELIKSVSPDIDRIVVARGRGGREIQDIIDAAKRKGIPVEFKSREELDAQAGKKTQGVIGYCRQFKYADLRDVIANRRPCYKDGLILILDSITDPQNLGSLIRTAYFFGANGVVIPENRAASVTAAVMKASAGAAHHLPVAMVKNLARALDELKEAGYWIYGTDAHGGEAVEQADFSGHVGLVMGSEGSGLRSLIHKKCDLMVSIPGSGEIDSLNVSVSAGIVLNRIHERRLKEI